MVSVETGFVDDQSIDHTPVEEVLKEKPTRVTRRSTTDFVSSRNASKHNADTEQATASKPEVLSIADTVSEGVPGASEVEEQSLL